MFCNILIMFVRWLANNICWKLFGRILFGPVPFFQFNSSMILLITSVIAAGISRCSLLVVLFLILTMLEWLSHLAIDFATDWLLYLSSGFLSISCSISRVFLLNWCKVNWIILLILCCLLQSYPCFL